LRAISRGGAAPAALADYMCRRPELTGPTSFALCAQVLFLFHRSPTGSSGAVEKNTGLYVRCLTKVCTRPMCSGPFSTLMFRMAPQQHTLFRGYWGQASKSPGLSCSAAVRSISDQASWFEFGACSRASDLCMSPPNRPTLSSPVTRKFLHDRFPAKASRSTSFTSFASRPSILLTQPPSAASNVLSSAPPAMNPSRPARTGA
jgi:hypothetical protein